ncbi:hypothetical protein STEG23_023810 [Scotinomys teguina]
MARKAGQGKEEEESRARQQEEKTPACHGRGHHVVEQEDENLWIASGLIWFDLPRPPDRSSDVPTSRSASRQLAQKMKPNRLLQSGLDHNPKVFFVSPLRTQRPLYQQEVA